MEEKEKEASEKQFNFKEWLNKCNLKSVENIFVHHKMTTLETLSMHNNNLSKLLSDKRVCSNSKLVSMIIISLQTLDCNKNNPTKNVTNKNKNNKKLKNIIAEIETKSSDIDKLENRLKTIEIKYCKQKKSSFEYLQKWKRKYLNDLNKSKKQITHTFSQIFEVLKEKEHSLLSELEKYDVISQELNIENKNEELDDEKKLENNNIFNEKYKANELIISDCKRYMTEQLNIFEIFMNNAENMSECSDKIDEMALNIDNMYTLQVKRFTENEKYMKQETNTIEKNKYNQNSVSFKLNEEIFTNIVSSMDNIGEILRYKKLEIEMKKVEWTDMEHINIYYEFLNIKSVDVNDINIQQYEIQYRYFDINMPDLGDLNDTFEWKTVLFPSRNISNNKMVANNPINISIEEYYNNNNITSDNDTLFFLKMRIKHNPYYLWSNYSVTYKRKAANFLLIAKNKTISLSLSQKKKRKGYRRKSYASTHSSASPKINGSLVSMSSYRRQSSTDLSEDNNSSYYHQYYTFDSVIIHENGCLTIDTNNNNSDNSINELNEEDNEISHPKGYLHIVIHRDLIIHRGGKINVSGLGYSGGTRYESGDSVNSFGELGQTHNNKGGGGGSKTYELGCGGGGGYATKGDNGCSGKGFGFSNNKTKYRQGIDGMGGCVYGDNQNMSSVCHFGSGGGGGDYGDSKGGNGGGIIIIDCKGKIIMNENSLIVANGSKGKYDSDGCGSGGSIVVKCKHLHMKYSAKIEATGAKNNLKGNGGNGGHGRIRMKCDDKSVQLNKFNIIPRPYIG